VSDRHNIDMNDGAGFPAYPAHASAGQLGQVIGALAALAPELNAPVVVEELRLAQYRRAVKLAEWVVAAGDDLAQALQAEMDRRAGR